MESNILYSIIQTKYGKTLIAMENDTLVAFLFLVGDEEKILKYFKKKLPHSKEVYHSNLQNIANDILMKKDVHFKMTGTEFQKTVWNELLNVKNIISYQELAEKIGKPKAVRAVANAVAKNLLHYIIPCHLVVRSSGEIGKYAGGVELKSQLIYEISNNSST